MGKSLSLEGSDVREYETMLDRNKCGREWHQIIGYNVGIQFRYYPVPGGQSPSRAQLDEK